MHHLRPLAAEGAQVRGCAIQCASSASLPLTFPDSRLSSTWKPDARLVAIHTHPVCTDTVMLDTATTRPLSTHTSRRVLGRGALLK